MSDVHSNIVTWLHDQKYWLQVAAKKLMDLGDVSDEDIGELSSLLKTEEGQRTDIKIDFTTFFDSDNSYGQLRISSIGEIKGIENLSPRVPLNFGDRNLAVIYGNNGSGKSGYTRILKKVCGKNNATELKPNVFEAEPDVRQCLIGFNYDDTEYTETWVANSDAIDTLVNVDIFDSHSGKFYLDSESDAAYIPETVALFEDLVDVCKRIKVLLESEKSTLQSKLPILPSGYIKTKYGAAFTTKLKAGIDEEKLKSYFNYTEEDENNQASFAERLKEAPSVQARQKRQHKKQLEILINTVNDAIEKVNIDACGTLFQLQQDAKNKRKIVIEGASASSISNAVLPGIGTETWMAMWQAAREYSVSIAYPSEKFPKTDHDSRCLLCHQRLGEEAKQRL